MRWTGRAAAILPLLCVLAVCVCPPPCVADLRSIRTGLTQQMSKDSRALLACCSTTITQAAQAFLSCPRSSLLKPRTLCAPPSHSMLQLTHARTHTATYSTATLTGLNPSPRPWTNRHSADCRSCGSRLTLCRLPTTDTLFPSSLLLNTSKENAPNGPLCIR